LMVENSTLMIQNLPATQETPQSLHHSSVIESLQAQREHKQIGMSHKKAKTLDSTVGRMDNGKR